MLRLPALVKNTHLDIVKPNFWSVSFRGKMFSAKIHLCQVPFLIACGWLGSITCVVKETNFTGISEIHTTCKLQIFVRVFLSNTKEKKKNNKNRQILLS